MRSNKKTRRSSKLAVGDMVGIVTDATNYEKSSICKLDTVERENDKWHTTQQGYQLLSNGT